jgi:HPt (histidine-containing phosphotransfer) domain-containing protein
VSALDPDFVDQLVEDLEPEELDLIVRTFGRDLERMLAALAAAATAGDRAGFGRMAHTLAGAAGAVGARPLQRTARHLVEPDPAEDLSLVLGLLRAQGREAMSALQALARAPRRPQA